MFYKIEKILITLSVFLTPVFVFAGPSVSWDSVPVINGGNINGSLVVSGIDATTPPLSIVIFSDSGNDFNPYISSNILGQASNATFPFQIPFGGNTSFLLPVLDGSFDGGTSFNPFTAYSVGQVANISTTQTVDPSDCVGQMGTTPCEEISGSTNCDEAMGTTNCEQISFSDGAQINNPLGEDLDIMGFLGQLFENFVKIALPILVLFTMWSGLQFVMARGNEDKLADAKQNFLYVIIGAAIVFGSWGLATILAGTVEQFEAFNGFIRLLV